MARRAEGARETRYTWGETGKMKAPGKQPHAPQHETQEEETNWQRESVKRVRFAKLAKDSVIGMASVTKLSGLLGQYMDEIDGVWYKPMKKHDHDQLLATKPYKPGGACDWIFTVRRHDLRQLSLCAVFVESRTVPRMCLLFQTYQAAPLFKVSEDQVLQS